MPAPVATRGSKGVQARTSPSRISPRRPREAAWRSIRRSPRDARYPPLLRLRPRGRGLQAGFRVFEAEPRPLSRVRRAVLCRQPTHGQRFYRSGPSARRVDLSRDREVQPAVRRSGHMRERSEHLRRHRATRRRPPDGRACGVRLLAGRRLAYSPRPTRRRAWCRHCARSVRSRSGCAAVRTARRGYVFRCR